jgi:endonuclease-3
MPPAKNEAKPSDPKARAVELDRLLAAAYPDARCALEHANPLQLLIATILSAQCTDVRVNMVTPGLFRRYPTAEVLAGAVREELEEQIRSTGFYRNKAKHIQESCQAIVDRYQGQVPDTMEELLTLPGVARKTANVVLGNAFGKAEGVVVDTHVQRVSQLLGLSNATDPVKLERDLMELLPRSEWTDFSHRVIFHGRQCCVARRPACDRCPVAGLCPSAGHAKPGRV